MNNQTYKGYYTLNDLKDNNIIDSDSFITSFQHNEDGKRYFILFETYIDFVNLIHKILPPKFHELITEDIYSFDDFFVKYPEISSKYNNIQYMLNFNEVITNDQPFRMFFDIDCKDMDIEKDVLLSETVEAILNYLKTEEKIDYPMNRIVVINGHKDDKISYHIILPDVAISNMETMKIIGEKIAYTMKEYSQYLDQSYMNLKNFRLLFNTKRGSKNFLKFQSEWTYVDKEDNSMEINFDFKTRNEYTRFTSLFDESIIQSFSTTEYFISSKIKPKQKLSDINLSNIEIEDILSDIKLPEGLEIGRIKTNSNFINLVNKGGFDCQICNKRHDKDNAFLMIREKGVYFKCFRSSGKCMKIKDIHLKPTERLDLIRSSVSSEQLNHVKNIVNKMSRLIDNHQEEKQIKQEPEYGSNDEEIGYPPMNENECAEWYLSFHPEKVIKITYYMNDKINGYRWNENKLLWINDLCNSKIIEHIKNTLSPIIKNNIELLKGKKGDDKIEIHESWVRFNNIFSKTSYLNCVKFHCRQHLFDDTFVSRLDNCPSILPVRGGIVDLKTGTFRQRTMEDYCSKECPVNWIEDIDYSEVEKIIGQILVDKQVYSFAQTFFGYCITGENDEKVFFIASGVGNNGKSLFFSQFEHLLGDGIYYSSCSKEIFLNSKYDKQTCPELFQLKGIRFSICSETDEQKELKESTIKAITGYDSISGRDLYKSTETIKLYCKLGLVTNHLPFIKSNSDAIWSRTLPINFISSFQDEHKDLDEKIQYQERKFPKDKNLLKRIESEEYKSKFLRWLVEGSKKYYHEGLTIPDAIKLSKQTYHSDSDILQDFIEENLERCPGSNCQVGFRDLYILFCKYCKDVKRLSEVPISDRKFKTKMEEKGIQSLRNNGTVFKGIKINTNI